MIIIIKDNICIKKYKAYKEEVVLSSSISLGGIKIFNNNQQITNEIIIADQICIPYLHNEIIIMMNTIK